MTIRSLLFLLLLPALAQAQFGPPAADAFHPNNEIRGTRPKTEHERKLKPDKELVRGIGFLPGRTHRIEGLSLSIWTRRARRQPLVVKGVNLDVQPIGAVFAMLMMVYQPFVVIRSDDNYNVVERGYAPTRDDTLVQIRGLDLRVAGCVPESALYGLGLSGAGSIYTIQHGVAISVAENITEHLYGLQLALWGNNADGGKGVQIGLFNRAEACNCLQFGLLNRNGSRVLPLVNWPRRERRQQAEMAK